MGTLNNCFYSYPISKKAVISLVFARKGGLKNMFFQTALMITHSIQFCNMSE
jgi:hypothetical protein